MYTESHGLQDQASLDEQHQAHERELLPDSITASNQSELILDSDPGLSGNT